MSDSSTKRAVCAAACIAFRHIDEVSEGEREQVLMALVELLPDAEAEIADRTLFHFREQRKAQLELAGILGHRSRKKDPNHG